MISSQQYKYKIMIKNIICLVVMLICTLTIIHTIEKHSVHPIFGNYTKFDSKGNSCHPYQACK